MGSCREGFFPKNLSKERRNTPLFWQDLGHRSFQMTELRRKIIVSCQNLNKGAAVLVALAKLMAWHWTYEHNVSYLDGYGDKVEYMRGWGLLEKATN